MKFKSALLVLAGVALSFGSPALAGDELQVAQSAAKDMSRQFGIPLEVEIAKPSQFLSVEGERVRIGSDTLSLVRGDKEAKALIALALAYRGRSMGKFVDRSGSPLNTVSAIGYTLLDSTRNSGGLPDARSIPNHTREEQRAYQAKLGAKRAALAIDIASRSGSCAAPMVDLLKRMRAAPAAEPASFARQALRDLGVTVLPPDGSCV